MKDISNLIQQLNDLRGFEYSLTVNKFGCTYTLTVSRTRSSIDVVGDNTNFSLTLYDSTRCCSDINLYGYDNRNSVIMRNIALDTEVKMMYSTGNDKFLSTHPSDEELFQYSTVIDRLRFNLYTHFLAYNKLGIDYRYKSTLDQCGIDFDIIDKMISSCSTTKEW